MREWKLIVSNYVDDKKWISLCADTVPRPGELIRLQHEGMKARAVATRYSTEDTSMLTVYAIRYSDWEKESEA